MYVAEPSKLQSDSNGSRGLLHPAKSSRSRCERTAMSVGRRPCGASRPCDRVPVQLVGVVPKFERAKTGLWRESGWLPNAALVAHAPCPLALRARGRGRCPLDISHDRSRCQACTAARPLVDEASCRVVAELSVSTGSRVLKRLSHIRLYMHVNCSAQNIPYIGASPLFRSRP